MSKALEDQARHRASATIVRKGHVVTDCTSGEVVFDGSSESPKLFPWSREDFKGINAAKRFIRKSGAVSYSV